MNSPPHKTTQDVHPGPLVGDAMGRICLDLLKGGSTTSFIELESGNITIAPTLELIAPFDEWSIKDQSALSAVRGRVLDVGAGTGRGSVELQNRGYQVTALDNSPGATETCISRGISDVFLCTIEEYATKNREKYDSFLLLGDNLGLLETRERAPRVLEAMATLARPGARIIATSTDPYASLLRKADGNAEAALRENIRHWIGQKGRIRYKNMASPWFHYLRCSVEELPELVEGTPWQLSNIDSSDSPGYVVEFTLK